MPMSKLDEVGDREAWRCWLCDEPVDPHKSVNDARGPSIDSINLAGKNGKSKPGEERLAHRACNTKKGAVKPVVPWPDRLFVIEPAPIIGVAERLAPQGWTRGGRQLSEPGGRRRGRQVAGRPTLATAPDLNVRPPPSPAAVSSCWC